MINEMRDAVQAGPREERITEGLQREYSLRLRTLNRIRRLRACAAVSQTSLPFTMNRGSSGFLVDVRSTPAPLCSFCGTGIDHCALA